MAAPGGPLTFGRYTFYTSLPQQIQAQGATTAGGNVTVAAGAAISAAGGSLYLRGGNAGAGNNNGGNVSIGGGDNAGSGHKGYIVLVDMPTADPSVQGAMYRPTGAGALSVSGG